MNAPDFIELVRTMRRDQLAFRDNRTSAAAMKARYSEKQVDDALATMPVAPPAPDLEEPVAIEVNP